MRNFPTECRGCYRESRCMACFITDILEQRICPCLSCLVKSNCCEICDTRKAVIEKFANQIQDKVYSKIKY